MNVAVIRPAPLAAAIRAALGRYTPALVRLQRGKTFIWKFV